MLNSVLKFIAFKLNNTHPIGSIYISVDDTNPSIYFGGEWERIANGKTLVGIDENDADFVAGKTGGEKTHTLTLQEMPTHGGHLYSTDGTWSDAGEQTYYLPLANVGKFSTNRPFVVRNSNEIVPRSFNRGASQSHNNLQPYIAVYMWKRIA